MSKTLKKKKHWSSKVQECTVSWGGSGEMVTVVEVRGGAELGEFPHLGHVVAEAMVCHAGRFPCSGDVLLEVNGTPVSGLTNRDTLAVVRHFREPIRLKTVKPVSAAATVCKYMTSFGKHRRDPKFARTMAVQLQRPHVAAAACLLVMHYLAGVLSIPDPRQREALIKQEASMQTGGQVVLSDAEQRLDALLFKMKQREVLRADFPPAMHFFKARDLIRSSPIFSLLQKMPKGGALHVHDFSMADPKWLVKNATYRPHCYMCFTDTHSVRFIFSSQWPKPLPRCSPWNLLETLRAKSSNTTDLDDSILRNLTLFTDQDPESVYPSQDVIWNRFEQCFLALWGLVTYAPVFRDYYYQGLTEFYLDNVMYLELRALLPQIYELDGSTHDSAWALKTYQDVTRQFTDDHPDFYGARIINTISRQVEISTMNEAVETAMKLQKDFPDIMAGFDLVGREDTGRPLWYFREALSLPAERGVTLPFYFHAGETDLEGTEVDQNLLDALLFNTSRIGHGFALPRHPVAKDISRKRGVAVEVCPISNQVLMLVNDLRNHPAAALMSENHPVVISSDDPAMFGASGLSYDFYVAFVGFGGLSSHLGSLKQLATNSIRFSSLAPNQQEKALDLWQRKWDKFVSETDFEARRP